MPDNKSNGSEPEGQLIPEAEKPLSLGVTPEPAKKEKKKKSPLAKKDRRFRQTIIRHEGTELRAKEDTLGNVYIGHGHDLGKAKDLVIADIPPITEEQAGELMDADIATTTREMDTRFPDWRKLPESQQHALVSLTYNVGPTGAAGFKKTLRYLEYGENEKAANEILKSKWAKQVKWRAVDVAGMILGRELEYIKPEPLSYEPVTGDAANEPVTANSLEEIQARQEAGYTDIRLRKNEDGTVGNLSQEQYDRMIQAGVLQDLDKVPSNIFESGAKALWAYGIKGSVASIIQGLSKPLALWGEDIDTSTLEGAVEKAWVFEGGNVGDRSFGRAFRSVANQFTPEDRARFRENSEAILAGFRKRHAERVDQNWTSSAAESMEAYGKGMKENIRRDYQFTPEQMESYWGFELWAGLGSMVPQLVPYLLTIPGTVYGGPPGAMASVAAARTLSMGMSTGMHMDEAAVNAVSGGASPDSYGGILTAALVPASFELMPIEKLTRGGRLFIKKGTKLDRDLKWAADFVLGEGLKRSVVAGTTKAFSQGGVELVQEYSSAVMQNVIAMGYNPDVSLTDEAWDQGLVGFGAGTILGGIAALVPGRSRRTPNMTGPDGSLQGPTNESVAAIFENSPSVIVRSFMRALGNFELLSSQIDPGLYNNMVAVLAAIAGDAQTYQTSGALYQALKQAAAQFGKESQEHRVLNAMQMSLSAVAKAYDQHGFGTYIDENGNIVDQTLSDEDTAKLGDDARKHVEAHLELVVHQFLRGVENWGQSTNTDAEPKERLKALKEYIRRNSDPMHFDSVQAYLDEILDMAASDKDKARIMAFIGVQMRVSKETGKTPNMLELLFSSDVLRRWKEKNLSQDIISTLQQFALHKHINPEYGASEADAGESASPDTERQSEGDKNPRPHADGEKVPKPPFGEAPSLMEALKSFFNLFATEENLEDMDTVSNWHRRGHKNFVLGSDAGTGSRSVLVGYMKYIAELYRVAGQQARIILVMPETQEGKGEFEALMEKAGLVEGRDVTFLTESEAEAMAATEGFGDVSLVAFDEAATLFGGRSAKTQGHMRELLDSARLSVMLHGKESANPERFWFMSAVADGLDDPNILLEQLGYTMVESGAIRKTVKGKGERDMLMESYLYERAAGGGYERRVDAKDTTPKFSQRTEEPAEASEAAEAAEGSSVARVRRVMARRIGVAALEALERLGLSIVDKVADLPMETMSLTRRSRAVKRQERGFKVMEGFHDPVSGKTHIIASSLKKDEDIWGVLLHEVGVHIGLENLLGSKRVKELANVIEAQAKKGNKWADDAVRNGKGLPYETVAYLVTYRPDLPIFAKLIARVRQALRALGIHLELSLDDIAVMIVGALRETEVLARGITEADVQAAGGFNSTLLRQRLLDIDLPIDEIADRLLSGKSLPPAGENKVRSMRLRELLKKDPLLDRDAVIAILEGGEGRGAPRQSKQRFSWRDDSQSRFRGGVRSAKVQVETAGETLRLGGSVVRQVADGEGGEVGFYLLGSQDSRVARPEDGGSVAGVEVDLGRPMVMEREDLDEAGMAELVRYAQENGYDSAVFESAAAGQQFAVWDLDRMEGTNGEQVDGPGLRGVYKARRLSAMQGRVLEHLRLAAGVDGKDFRRLAVAQSADRLPPSVAAAAGGRAAFWHGGNVWLLADRLTDHLRAWDQIKVAALGHPVTADLFGVTRGYHYRAAAEQGMRVGPYMTEIVKRVLNSGDFVEGEVAAAAKVLTQTDMLDDLSAHETEQADRIFLAELGTDRTVVIRDNFTERYVAQRAFDETRPDEELIKIAERALVRDGVKSDFSYRTFNYRKLAHVIDAGADSVDADFPARLEEREEAGDIKFSGVRFSEKAPPEAFNENKEYDSRLDPWLKGLHPELLDENGRAKTVFHGTEADPRHIASVGFSLKALASNTRAWSALEGVWFSDSKQVARRFARSRGGSSWDGFRIMQVHLAIKNPLVVTKEMFEENPDRTTWARRAKKDGHDGVVFKEMVDYGTSDNYLVWDTSQIVNAADGRRLLNQNEIPDAEESIASTERNIARLERIIEENVQGYPEGQHPHIVNVNSEKSKLERKRASLRNITEGTVRHGPLKFSWRDDNRDNLFRGGVREVHIPARNGKYAPPRDNDYDDTPMHGWDGNIRRTLTGFKTIPSDVNFDHYDWPSTRELVNGKVDLGRPFVVENAEAAGSDIIGYAKLARELGYDSMIAHSLHGVEFFVWEASRMKDQNGRPLEGDIEIEHVAPAHNTEDNKRVKEEIARNLGVPMYDMNRVIVLSGNEDFLGRKKADNTLGLFLDGNSYVFSRAFTEGFRMESRSGIKPYDVFVHESSGHNAMERVLGEEGIQMFGQILADMNYKLRGVTYMLERVRRNYPDKRTHNKEFVAHVFELIRASAHKDRDSFIKLWGGDPVEAAKSREHFINVLRRMAHSGRITPQELVQVVLQATEAYSGRYEEHPLIWAQYPDEPMPLMDKLRFSERAPPEALDKEGNYSPFLDPALQNLHPKALSRQRAENAPWYEKNEKTRLAFVPGDFYHGSSEPPETLVNEGFSVDALGKSTNADAAKLAVWFSTLHVDAADFSNFAKKNYTRFEANDPSVVMVYLAIENPLVVTKEMLHDTNHDAAYWIKRAQESGHDAAILEQRGRINADHYAVWDTSKIIDPRHRQPDEQPG